MKMFLKGLVAAAGLLMTCVPAQAVTLQFQINPTGAVGGVPNPEPIGTYRITMTSVGDNAFDFELIGLNNGAATDDDATRVTIGIRNSSNVSITSMATSNAATDTLSGAFYTDTNWLLDGFGSSTTF